MLENRRKTLMQILTKSRDGLWAVFLLSLPFTSLPLVTKIIGSQMVAIPSGLIVLLLVAVWLIPVITRGLTIPNHTLPLLLFALIALVATILAFFYPLPSFKGVSSIKENLESVVTLFLGVILYLVTLLWLREKKSEAEFDRTLRFITIGGIFILVKVIIEFLLWRQVGRYPAWYRDIHNLFSTGTLFRARVTAFAYEPSWLADQLNLLYIPYWFAASITRRSAFKRRLWIFQVEDFCLVFGILALIFTLSRLGYLSFLLMIGVLFIHGTAFAADWIQKRVTAQIPRFQEKGWRNLLRVGVIFLIAIIYLGLLFAAVFTLRALDYRNAEIFNIDLKKFNLIKYAEELSFGARVSYWGAGWNIFNQYPLLGVGLGNAGFYFPQQLPAYAWRLREIRELMFHTSSLLNIKSLWFRILAETGIIGFTTFAAFLTVVFVLITQLRRSEHELAKMLNWMGTFAFAAFFIEELSLDSFALPYFWVAFGIAAAGYEYLKTTDANK